MKKADDKVEKQEDKDDYALLEFSKKSSKKKRTVKSLLLLLFNILVIAIIIIIEFTGNRKHEHISTVLATWANNWYFILILFALVALYYLCLTGKISLLIRAATGRPRRKLSFSTAVLGKYYDNITPFGSGGQPFQMFNLGRKLDVGLATSIPIADFIINQLVFTLMGIVVFIVNKDVMAGNDTLRYAAYIGIVFYAAIPVAVILFSLFPGAIRAITRFFCRVGHKLHLIKDLEKAEAKAISGVQKYSSSLKLVGKKWRYLVISAVVSVVSWLALNSIPYFVLRACGVEEAGYFNTVCMSIYVYAAITVIPTPGNAGAAEGAFYAIFRSLSGGFLFWGTMLWRVCVYYISLISGFAITVYQYAKVSHKEHNAAKLRLATGAESGSLDVGDSANSQTEAENPLPAQEEAELTSSSEQENKPSDKEG